MVGPAIRIDLLESPLRDYDFALDVCVLEVLQPPVSDEDEGSGQASGRGGEFPRPSVREAVGHRVARKVAPLDG